MKKLGLGLSVKIPFLSVVIKFSKYPYFVYDLCKILGGLDHWEVVCSGGDGFTVEESPGGCKKLSECCPSVKGLYDSNLNKCNIEYPKKVP